jgi:hypothetical protein
METIEKFRVNYFVSGLLAQGGELSIVDDKIRFSPTSAVDRAFGAVDVEIPLASIVGVDYIGALSRAFYVRTNSRLHKFEGGQTKVFWERLEKVLPKTAARPLLAQGSAEAAKKPAVPVAPVHHPSLACVSCSKPLQPGFSHCPHCASVIKSGCTNCHRAVDPQWSACAYCGWKLVSSQNLAA